MTKAKKIEERIVTKNYKAVLLETLIEKVQASSMELTKKIKDEIPFLKFESEYKVKAEYVLPTLKKSKCFLDMGADIWSLSKDFLNLENYAYQVLKKRGHPMKHESLTEAIAEENGLHPSDIPLKLDHDDRFYTEIVGGQSYYFIQEWEFCNEYALATLVTNQNKPMLATDIAKQVVASFKKKKNGMILMFLEDPRFKENTDGKVNLVPRFYKKVKCVEISKSDLDKIAHRLEGDVKSLSLVDIADEFLGVPFPLTNLEEIFTQDKRFQMIGNGKVKRSRLSMDEIREIKREELRKKRAQTIKIKAEIVAKAPKIEPEIPEIIVQVEPEPVIEEPVIEEPVLFQEPVVAQSSGFMSELKRLELLRQQEAEQKKSQPVPQKIELQEKPEPKPEPKPLVIVKKEPAIKKSASIQRELFDVAATGVDMDDLEGFLKELTDRDGLSTEVNPEKFDELLRRNLPFKVPDYRPSNPQISQFMVRLARPRLNQLVVDFACGRGDILLKILEYVKGSLRKENAQDKEMFATFLDEQIVGMDISEFVVRSGRLGLKLNGFEISLLQSGNAQQDTDLLIDEMYSIALSDLTHLNSREVCEMIKVAKRVLMPNGEGIFVVHEEFLGEGSELSQFLAENFFLKHQIVLMDIDGIRKSVIHLIRDSGSKDRTKLYRLENLEQLNRVLDLIY